MKKRKRTNQLTGGFWSTVPRKLVVLAEPPDPAGDGSCGDVLPALPGALVFVLELPVLAPAGSGETPSPLPFALPPVVIADVEVVDDTEDANAEVEPDARADVEADVDVDTDADVDEEDDDACCWRRSRIPLVWTPSGRIGAAPTYPAGFEVATSMALVSLDSLCVR